MKRILLPLALLLAACSTTEYIQVDQSTPVLVMNAQMRVQEDIHYIHLSRSLLSTLSAEPGATVSVSVNGAAPVMASEVGSGGGNSCMYEFNTAIKSGDVVAVHAVSSDNIEVSSSFSVPQNVLLGGISITENVVHSSLYDDLFSLSGEVDDSPRWAQINVVLNDVPAVENYYRIELWTDEIISGTRVSYPFSLVDTTSDPVLTPVSSGSLIEMLTSEANNYNVFSDMAFAERYRQQEGRGCPEKSLRETNQPHADALSLCQGIGAWKHALLRVCLHAGQR